MLLVLKISSPRGERIRENDSTHISLQDHPKFKCLPPGPESEVAKPEEDLSPDEDDPEQIHAESEGEEEEEAGEEEEESHGTKKRNRSAVDLEDGSTSSSTAFPRQPKMVEPLAMMAPIPEADEKAAKKKKALVFAAITSSG